MTAADIMQTDFPFVDCDVTVAEAEELFEQEGLAALPVLNPDRTVFGLLTPNNLAHFHGRPLNNPRAFHAWEICDARPLVVARGEAVEEIKTALLATPSGHMLVIDDEQRLIGVISAAALLKHDRPSQQSGDDLISGTVPPASRTR